MIWRIGSRCSVQQAAEAGVRGELHNNSAGDSLTLKEDKRLITR